MLNNEQFIQTLNQTLKNGGVIAFVTDTVWGVGCLPTSEKGVEKIYNMKGRDRSKPLILMSNSVENMLPYVKFVPETAQKLINEHFPGALTIILKKSDLTPDFMTSGMDTVGIRVPDNKFFSQLCSVIEGDVLATTSANVSTMPSAKTYAEANEYIGQDVDYIFEDCGHACAGVESTVVLAKDDSVKILRQGSVKI